MAFDSLFTGITGLNAYQSWIDMLSNNIANTATTGFKGQRMTFADLFYTSQGYASGPSATRGGVNPQQVGLGVKVNSIDTQFAQGGLETTGVNTDLAINGDGFFVMRNVNGSSAPAYTRDGAFSLNSNGLLYDPSSGMAVQVYTANRVGGVNANGVLGNITIPLGIQSEATGTGFGAKVGPTVADRVFDVSMVGNLDQSQWQAQEQFVASGAGLPGTAKTISTTIYDSLGNAHAMTLVYKPDATGAAAGPPAASGLPATVNDANGNPQSVATRWQVQAYFADGTQVDGAAATSAAPYTVGYAFFDKNGQYVNTSGIANPAVAADVHAAGSAASDANGNQLNITQWGNGASNLATSPTAGVPPATGPIGIDFADNTSLAGDSTATVISQNGFGSGTLANITIAQDGSVNGAFTNGQVRTLAQIALATFQNEGGLSRSGGNAFAETNASGLAQIGIGGVGRLGSIVSGALEQSNVSLADQFTKLIVAQRAFEANTRGITTADQNLQTVINLRASEN
jgi:flagellar hook protein FlgE